MTDISDSERMRKIANTLKEIERECSDLEMYDSAYILKNERERIESRTPRVATYFVEHAPRHATSRSDGREL